jgi:hypothetical protein
MMDERLGVVEERIWHMTIERKSESGNWGGEGMGGEGALMGKV